MFDFFDNQRREVERHNDFDHYESAKKEEERQRQKRLMEELKNREFNNL